jgi:hypothetical protein
MVSLSVSYQICVSANWFISIAFKTWPLKRIYYALYFDTLVAIVQLTKIMLNQFALLLEGWYIAQLLFCYNVKSLETRL